MFSFNHSDREFNNVIGFRKDMARSFPFQKKNVKITKMIKETGMKVQASIQGEQIRVTGKKRDDLQDVMAFLRQAKVDIPLQFTNFRD